ncbi:MAG: hypothetical protein ACT4NY_02130 [Pseudonocardiales bacterium]
MHGSAVSPVALTPDAAQPRRLVDEQIERNRTFTVLITVAAVLNTAIAAWVVGAAVDGVAAVICLLLIAATIGAVWVFADQLIPRRWGLARCPTRSSPGARGGGAVGGGTGDPAADAVRRRR